MSAARVLRVAIVGASGKMGRFASALLGDTEGFEVVARVERADDLATALRESRAAVGLDVTVAGRGFEHGRTMLECGVRPVIGTSGVSLEQNAELDRLARQRKLGGIVVPNFSIGMWLLQRAALDAAPHMPRVEIVEMHHESKKDAPSGTASDTAERLRDAGAGPEIAIHSIRLPGLHSHQVVLFAAEGETYTLRHDTSGPKAFGPGILMALRHAATAEGVARGLGAACNPGPRH